MLCLLHCRPESGKLAKREREIQIDNTGSRNDKSRISKNVKFRISDLFRSDLGNKLAAGGRSIAKSFLVLPLLHRGDRSRRRERGNGGGGAAVAARMRGRPNGVSRRQTPVGRVGVRTSVGRRASESGEINQSEADASPLPPPNGELGTKSDGWAAYSGAHFAPIVIKGALAT